MDEFPEVNGQSLSPAFREGHSLKKGGEQSSDWDIEWDIDLQPSHAHTCVRCIPHMLYTYVNTKQKKFLKIENRNALRYVHGLEED